MPASLRRITSRSLRLTRLRTTALPTRRLTEKPTRVNCGRPGASCPACPACPPWATQPSVSSLPETRLPWARTRWKSRGERNRCARRNRSPDRVRSGGRCSFSWSAPSVRSDAGAPAGRLFLLATAHHPFTGREAREAHKMRLVRHTARHSGYAYGMRRMRDRSPRSLTHARRLDDGQAPAPLETAGLQDIAPRLAAHPFHKAVLTLPWDALRLPGSFHGCSIVPFPREYTK